MKNILFLVFFSILIIFSYSIQADTNSTVSSTVITSTPSTANAPSVVVNNSDVCKTGSSTAVQTQVFGIAQGLTIRDENCERIKLSRQLYAMGMKVGAVTLLAQDYRVFDALWNAGTFPPINGLIGLEAKEEWFGEEVNTDLDSMSKIELEALGREHGIELDRRKNKADLIEELKEVL